MSEQRVPQAEHPQFDALCEGLEEYDALPELGVSPNEERSREEAEEQLAQQLLAGLVSPY